MKRTQKQVIKQEIKVEEKNEDPLSKAFDLFDSNNGKIDPKEIREAMHNIGYDNNKPSYYQIVAELDTPYNSKNGGVNFEDFSKTVNNRLSENNSAEELRKIYDLFLDDPNSSTTSFDSIKRVAEQLGLNMDDEELNAMLGKVSKSGAELTFDDFVSIMSGK